MNAKLPTTANAEAKQLLAILNGVRPTTQVQGVAAAWLWMKWASRNPHIQPTANLAEFRAITDQITRAFFNRVYLEWNPGLLMDLASEMKSLNPETWQPESDKWFLHEAGKQGPVNLTKLAERIAELETPAAKQIRERERLKEIKTTAVLRRLRRKAHSDESVKTLDAGRPKK